MVESTREYSLCWKVVLFNPSSFTQNKSIYSKKDVDLLFPQPLVRF